MVNSLRNSSALRNLNRSIEPIRKQPLNVRLPKKFTPQPHVIKFNHTNYQNNLPVLNRAISSRYNVRFFSTEPAVGKSEKVETSKPQQSCTFLKIVLLSTVGIGAWAIFRNNNPHKATIELQNKAMKPQVKIEDFISRNKALVEELLLNNKDILEKHIKLMPLRKWDEEKEEEYLIICDQQKPLSLPVDQFKSWAESLTNGIIYNKRFVETLKKDPFWSFCSDADDMCFKVNTTRIVWYAEELLKIVTTEHYKYLLSRQDYQNNLDTVKKNWSHIVVLNEHEDITKTTMRHTSSSKEFNLFMTKEEFSQQLKELQELNEKS